MKVRGTDFVVYQVSDMDRSLAFYRDTLGMELGDYYEEFGWAEFVVEPTTLALYSPAKHSPGAEPQVGGASIALAVEDVKSAVQELRGKGITVFMDTMDTPVCYYAVVADPDGNAVGLHCRKDGTFG